MPLLQSSEREIIDLKLISKRSIKSERTNVFEAFEQSDETYSDLEVSK